MKWFHALRARLRLLLRRDADEARTAQEFRFHIEMETDRLVRDRGLTPAEARRRALAAFGGVEAHKEALRDGRGLAWLSGLRIDVKLAARTLARYPGVTVIGGIAMAIGVGLGAAYLEILGDFMHPTLPLEDGKRIVGLQNWDVSANAPEPRSTHDFVRWREEVRSLEDLGAFRSIERNVGLPNVMVEPAPGAEITASAFRLARVPARLGRTLIDADERDPGARVVVLGYRLWQTRFGGDARVVGQPAQLGRTTVTIVGVMPEGFGFPVNHEFWIPFHADAVRYEPRQGPPIQMFGRLTPGVSLQQAGAELEGVGVRASAESPSTHQYLRPRVVPYPELFLGSSGSAEAYLVQLIFVVLVIILASNVATMIFARTAVREHEIAMRFALGSTRGRIVGQFFVEALVLSLAATVVGLAVVSWGADWVTRLLWQVTGSRVPFWLDGVSRLSVTTVLYAVALAVLGSAVAGVMPALKATRSRLQSRLRHVPGTGGPSLRFGGLWSAVIVLQVAFAVMVVPPAIVAMSSMLQPDHADPGFRSDEYLSARVEMDAESFEQFHAVLDDLRQRLIAEPRVSRVTLANRLSGMDHPQPEVEVDGGRDAPAAHEIVMAACVGADYFDALGITVVAGRGFTPSDGRAVIVNEAFVNDVLQGRNPVGRRLRYATRYGERAATGQPGGLPRTRMLEAGDWYEIVGVVEHVGMDTTKDAFSSGAGPGIFHPLSPSAWGADGLYSVRMAFHVNGDAEAFAPELRELARAVSPALRLYDVLPLDRPIDDNTRTERVVGRFFAIVTGLVALIALLISVAGVYSVLSFTVARQAREIGIRIALGADRRRIVSGVFSRAMVQITVGLIAGAVLWFFVVVRQTGGGDSWWLVTLTAVVLALVAFAACGIPVRRALRIEPTEALKDVG